MQRDTQPLALIVGGSSGMGLATAKLLLARHLRTVLVGNMAAKLEAAQRELSSMGPVEVLQANLYEPRDVARIVAFVQDHTRHIKHLVNAAGYFKPTPFLDHTGEDYDTYLDLNRALFFISQAVAKNMAANGGGSIVHIGSMWARQAIKATLLGLFNGESRAARPHATYGNGTGRPQHSSQRRLSGGGQDAYLSVLH